jgi:hypothetical protein
MPAVRVPRERPPKFCEAADGVRDVVCSGLVKLGREVTASDVASMVEGVDVDVGISNTGLGVIVSRTGIV